MIHHAHPLTLLIITLCYFIFALQIVWQTRWSRVKMDSAVALGSLVVVFVFCALSGYLTTLFGPEWAIIREVMHVILAAASVVLVISNRARIISKLMERE